MTPDDEAAQRIRDAEMQEFRATQAATQRQLAEHAARLRAVEDQLRAIVGESYAAATDDLDRSRVDPRRGDQLGDPRG